MAQKTYTKRNEKKYFINYPQYCVLRSLLAAVMDRDKYSNDEGFYFVRSIYFDSFNKKDFNEKEIGISHRRKIRFRYYEEIPKIIKLETKEKMDKHTIKESISLNITEAEEIARLDCSSIMEAKPRLYDHIMSHHYIPSTVVDYEREAYVSNLFDIRITFDMNIRGTKLADRVFREGIATFPLIDPALYILEVKHSGHIPDIIQEILACVELTQVTYSKYYYSMFL